MDRHNADYFMEYLIMTLGYGTTHSGYGTTPVLWGGGNLYVEGEPRTNRLFNVG